MRRLLLLAAAAIVIPACHGGDRTRTTVGVGIGVGVGEPPPTETLIQATNYDVYDYALWLEWQDPSGYWNQTFLFNVYGDSSVGPTMNFEVLLANPAIPYTLLLVDFDGSVWDSFTFWLPSGSVADLQFDVFDGYLYRTF